MRVALVLAAACGRSGFDAHGDAFGSGSGDGSAGPQPAMWFPFEDPAFSTSFADVASGFAGSCSGTTCPVSTAGHRGSSEDFDGVNDCIIVPDMGQASPANLTAAVWLREPAAVKATLFAKRVDLTGGPTAVWQLEIGLDQHVQFTFVVNSVELSAASVPGALTAGTWHHLAGTYDGTVAKVYLDGALAGSHSVSGALTYDTNVATIGCESNTAFQEFFAGAIDEAQVYDRALSASEIAALAAN